jgi:ATP-dependent Zn protease
MCKGTAVSKGAIPGGQPVGQPVATSWQPVGSAFGASLSGTANQLQQQQLANQLQPVSNQLYPNQLAYPAYEDLQQRVVRLENEYQHMVVERNSPGGLFGLDKNALIILIAIGLLIYFISEQQRSSRCPTTEGNTKAPSKSKAMGNIGDKVVSKFTDRFVTKAADSLFK